MSDLEKNFDAAANVIKSGGVIAYPTEAVWGLGCDPFNLNAVNTIIQLKQRSSEKALILIASDVSQLGQIYFSLTPAQQLCLVAPRDNPTTWLIQDIHNHIPKIIKGPYLSVAVRITNHPDVVALCDVFGGMIVSTSANTGGNKPATSLSQVKSYFGTDVDYYLNGTLGSSTKPSQIVDLMSGEIVRS